MSAGHQLAPAPWESALRNVVTYRNLGLYGRLGNQLWQIASVIGHALQADADIRLPPWRYQPAFNVLAEWFTGGWEDACDVTDCVPQLPSEARPYMQDTGLWWRHRTAVRRHLSLSSPAISAALGLYGEVLTEAPVTAMHVRRGDYLSNQQKYGLPSAGFYESARAMNPDSRLIIFTDDPAWVIRNLDHLLPDMVSSGPADFIDLACMTLCQNHIIANSSFSWWGAFLSGSDSVIYPRDWYRSSYSHHMSNSMFPPTWTVGG